MSLVRWADFLDEVMPHVPGCETDLAAHAIQRAVTEFCRRSLVVRSVTDPLTIEPGGEPVDLDSPMSGMIVCKALAAKLISEPLWMDPSTAEALDAWKPNWRTDVGDIQYFTQDIPGQLLVALQPAAAMTDALLVRIALAPARTAVGAESWIFDTYNDAIASGAIGRLMATPKKPWTNLELSGAHLANFSAGIGAAAAMAAKGHGRAPLRTVSCP